MTNFIMIHTTTPTLEEAELIARALVEEKLAACASIVEGRKSIYRWQGKVEEAQEYRLHIDTRADLFEDVEARVKSLHSYDCPCIVAFPIEKGSQEFLDWIDQSVV